MACSSENRCERRRSHRRISWNAMPAASVRRRQTHRVTAPHSASSPLPPSRRPSRPAVKPFVVRTTKPGSDRRRDSLQLFAVDMSAAQKDARMRASSGLLERVRRACRDTGWQYGAGAQAMPAGMDSAALSCSAEKTPPKTRKPSRTSSAPVSNARHRPHRWRFQKPSILPVLASAAPKPRPPARAEPGSMSARYMSTAILNPP